MAQSGTCPECGSLHARDAGACLGCGHAFVPTPERQAFVKLSPEVGAPIGEGTRLSMAFTLGLFVLLIGFTVLMQFGR